MTPDDDDDARDVQARFGARFVTTARARLEAVRQGATRGEQAAAVFHDVAGEAALLGYDGVAELARRADARARAASRERAEPDGCVALAAELLAALAEVDSSNAPRASVEGDDG